jgi:hypothetical protein
MNVRNVELRGAARADRSNDGALRDGGVLRHGDQAEVRQRHRQTVGGVDRDRLAARRHRPREADDTGGRREHRCAGVTTDVDAAMLAARVRMRRIEREPLEHGAAHGPRPGSRRGHPEHE